jgi:alpha-tubulin suppressor-like RCC1 family protein
LRQECPREVSFDSHGKRDVYISHIKAGGDNSAALDNLNHQAYTWGSFGQLRLLEDGEKCPAYAPHPVELNLSKDRVGRMFACPQGELEAPGYQLGALTRLEKITNLHSIDWGPNHVLFLDEKRRLFTLGSNHKGKTGLGLTIVDEEWHTDYLENMEPDSDAAEAFKSKNLKNARLRN